MRVFTRVVAAALAALLVAGAVLVFVETTLRLAEADPWLVDARLWFDDLTSAPWSSPGHRLVLAMTLAAGLALLILAWYPRRPVTVAVRDGVGTADVEVRLRRRDVERRLATAAREASHVTAARARADDRVVATVDTTRAGDESVRQSVEQRVSEATARLALDPAVTKVKVHSGGGRAA